ncbi:phage antirepressor KilAC domain-containing protein [Catenuloplanes japonicus]|uniref:phage antirepressor KilAC domain-containing protein n=1 Tax=Catenuloplanes japonicus TaxID=33876 RepID=UPI0006907E0F|nr:phage antirepressor KilAC domain-containing protein [Catenuloplanes japonicus]
MQITRQPDTLVDNRHDRDRYAGRVDALDKVKALVLLPDDVHATTEMVAAYYEVPIKTVRSVVVDHRAELEISGYQVITGQPLSRLKELSGIATRSPSLALFPRPAVLRVGMLLRDSPVAVDVRTYLIEAERAARLVVPPPAPPAVPDFRDTAVAVDVLGQMLELAKEHQALELANAIQARELATTRPKAAFVDNFVNPTGDTTLVRIFAQQIGMTEGDLRTWLEGHGLIYRRFVEKRWSKSRRAMVDEWQWLARAGYATWFSVKDQPNAPRHHNGQYRTTLYVTAVGKERIRALLAKRPAAIEA